MLKRTLLLSFLFVVPAVCSMNEEKTQHVKPLIISVLSKARIEGDKLIYKEKKYPCSSIESLDILDPDVSGRHIIFFIKLMPILKSLDISSTKVSTAGIIEIITNYNISTLKLPENFFNILFSKFQPNHVEHIIVSTSYSSKRRNGFDNNIDNITDLIKQSTARSNYLANLKSFSLEIAFSAEIPAMKKNEQIKISYPKEPHFEKQALNKNAKELIESLDKLSSKMENISIKEIITPNEVVINYKPEVKRKKDKKGKRSIQPPASSEGEILYRSHRNIYAYDKAKESTD